ncbi:MAG: ATP-binding protein [Myxococcota bacterium]
MNISLKRIKLRNLILIFTAIFLIPILLILKYSQYAAQKREIYEQFESVRRLTDNNIITSVKMVDNAYHIIEEIIRPNLYKFLLKLREEYEEKGGVDEIELRRFRENLDYPFKDGLDFYIIDEHNVIVETTYSTDKRLDFKRFPDPSGYLDKIRSGDEFVLDRLTVETLTGQYRIFAYLPTSDHKYILEVGCKLLQFREILEEYNFMRVSERIKEINPLLEYVRVYDRHGHIFGNVDFKPSEELKERIFNLFYERRGSTFDINGEDKYFIFVDLNDSRYPTDSSKIVEVKYKIKIIKDKINKAFLDVVLNGILLFLISLFIAYVISYLIEHPLSKMVQEIDVITGGDLKKRVSGSNISELDRLAQNINKMVDSIEGHISQIRRQQEEKERLENQLRQSQKMEAIGLLSGGIAHDFNNIMSAILGYTNLLQMQFNNNKDVRSKLDQIVSAIERGTRLIRILMTFSRRQAVNFRTLDLNEVIANINKLLRRLIGEDIRLNIKFSSESAMVLADPTNIEQVIMNLVTNARDAMPQGGELTIEVSIREVDEEQAKAHNAVTGKYVVLSVIDTGKGIEKENLEKIFDPFFTTKEAGKGTGLGLSVVYSIIKQHNGFIAVESGINKGTRFDLYIPYNSEGDKVEGGLESDEFIEGGSETILLVEDDNDIRNSLRFILERYGYKVIEAENGMIGYVLFKENMDKIDLILSDVVMPELSGVKMYERISELKNGIKIIFMSGYSEEVLEQRISKSIDVLFKPIPPVELLRKIREKLKE